jgi:hypothetical protein
MTGMKIVLPTTFSDPSLPVLRDDPILTAGSLLLVDPAHPAKQWPAGVPANNGTVPNLAWKEAVAAIGSGTESALAAVIERSSAITGALGLVERSAKGGLHVILSATTLLASGQGVAIRPGQPVIDYMVANPNHAYFFSLWFKGTRFTNGNGAPHSFTLSSTQDTSNLWFVNNSAGPGSFPITGAGSKNLGSRRSLTDLRTGTNPALTPPYSSPVIFNGAVSGYTGTPALTGAAALAKNKVFNAGNIDWFKEGATVAAASRLFWRAYIEDLTVSGRSYQQVDGIDFAEYQKQVLTTGGRYHGDTYTDPATIA